MSDPKPRGQVIFLTGPTLAGKTTTAMAWAAQRSRITAPMDWDQLRGTLFHGSRLQAADEISTQYRFAARVATMTAAHIIDSGFDCLIAGPRVPAGPTDPPSWVGVWDELDQLEPITIALLPSVDTRLERLRLDTGRVQPPSEDHVRESHRWAWESWREQPRAAVLDTSEMTLDQVLVAVEQTATRLADPGPTIPGERRASGRM